MCGLQFGVPDQRRSRALDRFATVVRCFQFRGAPPKAGFVHEFNSEAQRDGEGLSAEMLYTLN